MWHCLKLRNLTNYMPVLNHTNAVYFDGNSALYNFDGFYVSSFVLFLSCVRFVSCLPGAVLGRVCSCFLPLSFLRCCSALRMGSPVSVPSLS